MCRKFRLGLLIVVAALIAVPINGSVRAYDSPPENWTVGTVNRNLGTCAASAIIFNSTITNLNTDGSGYNLWVVVADTSSYTTTSRIWMAWAPNFAYKNPPLTSPFSLPITIYRATNDFGGLNPNASYPLPNNIPLYIQVALVRSVPPYSLQSVQVYSFHCTDPAGSTPAFEYGCQGTACGGVRSSSLSAPAALNSRIPFPLRR